MLMKKSQGVHQLVSHMTSVLTAASQRQKLFPAFFADVRLTDITGVNSNRTFFTSQSNILQWKRWQVFTFNSSNLREYIEQSRKIENQTAFSRRSLARKSTTAIKVLRYITDYMNREPIARKGKTTSKKYYTEWWITKQCLKFAPTPYLLSS